MPAHNAPYEIKIKLNHPKELFNSLDPSPFLERDLDPQAADYITDSVKDISLKRKAKLVVIVPKTYLNKISADIIKKAIHNYYDYLIRGANKRFNNLIRDGRKSLSIGITFLAACLLLSEIASKFPGFISNLFSEGFIIAGWVALWHPISIFLYDWWPILKEIKIFKKIKEMPIKIEVI